MKDQKDPLVGRCRLQQQLVQFVRCVDVDRRLDMSAFKFVREPAVDNMEQVVLVLVLALQHIHHLFRYIVGA